MSFLTLAHLAQRCSAPVSADATAKKSWSLPWRTSRAVEKTKKNHEEMCLLCLRCCREELITERSAVFCVLHKVTLKTLESYPPKAQQSMKVPLQILKWTQIPRQVTVVSGCGRIIRKMRTSSSSSTTHLAVLARSIEGTTPIWRAFHICEAGCAWQMGWENSQKSIFHDLLRQISHSTRPVILAHYFASIVRLKWIDKKKPRMNDTLVPRSLHKMDLMFFFSEKDNSKTAFKPWHSSPSLFSHFGPRRYFRWRFHLSSQWSILYHSLLTGSISRNSISCMYHN